MPPTTSSSITVQIDARALAYGGFIVEGATVPADRNGLHSTGWVTTTADGFLYRLTLTGPGSCQFVVMSGVGPIFSFTVGDDGTVGYDASLTYLSGAGTDTLTVAGLAMTIDASRIYGGPVQLRNALASVDITDQPLRLLPAPHQLIYGSAQVMDFSFTVEDTGTFSYPADLDTRQHGFLAGAGTSTLVLAGYPIVVDARGSGATALEFANITGAAPDLILQAALLPYSDYRFVLYPAVVTNSGVQLALTTGGTYSMSPLLARYATLDLTRAVPVLRFRAVPPPETEPSPVTLHSDVFCDVTLSGAILLRWQDLAHVAYDATTSVQQHLGRAVRTADGATVFFERGLLHACDPTAPAAPGSNDWLTDVAYLMLDDIYRYYLQHGDVTGPLGTPVADPLPPHYNVVTQQLSGALMTTEPAWGTHALTGMAAELMLTGGRWNEALGAATSTTYEVPPHRSAGVAPRDLPAGKRLVTTFTDGTLFDLPIGSYSVSGQFSPAYAAAGGVSGPLGAPTSDLSPATASGTVYQDFEGGVIVQRRGAKPIVVTDLELFFESCEAIQDQEPHFPWEPWHVNLYLQLWVYVNGTDMYDPDDPYKLPDDHSDYGTGDDIDFTSAKLTAVKSTDVIGVHVHGKDHFSGPVSDRDLGDIDVQFSVDNAWGLGQAWEHDDDQGRFKVNFGMRRPAGVIDFTAPGFEWRQNLYWAFTNFDTDDLTQLQCADTYSDIGADDRWFFHPIHEAFYEWIYKHSADDGNCFGMCLMSNYSQQGRTLRTEPVWDSNDYIAPNGGQQPVADPAVLDDVNVFMGYQLNTDALSFILDNVPPGFITGGVRTFKDSKAQFDAGDWPIICMTSDTLKPLDGHAVTPYKWQGDPDTDDFLYIYVANPNSPFEWDPKNPGHPTVPDDDPTCRIVINRKADDWSFYKDQHHEWSDGWLFSLPQHIVDTKGTSLCDEIVLLSKALAGAIAILASGCSVAQASSGDQQYYPAGPAADRGAPAAARPDGLLRVPLISGSSATPGPELWGLSSDVTTEVSFELRADEPGAVLQYGLLTVPGSFTFSAPLPPDVTDTVTVTAIGQDDQQVRYTAGADQPAKTLEVTAEAYRGSLYRRSYPLAAGQSVTFTLTACGTVLNDPVT